MSGYFYELHGLDTVFKTFFMAYVPILTAGYTTGELYSFAQII